jgi:hypothetical protein
VGERAGHAAYRLCRDVVRVHPEDDGVAYLARLPGGPIHVLPGPAALILDAALRVPSSAIVSRVAEQFAVPAAEIEEDVQAFVADLERSGLIEATDSLTGSQPAR